jgi:hypothetical protein
MDVHVKDGIVVIHPAFTDCFYLDSDSNSFINGESVEMNGGTYFN